MYKIKPIAIYLPQFHPIPENDKWWGKGFTEWTNVSKAKPLFKGHYQPQLPADLGFYDLRLEEARFAQEQLAKEFGIYGFCYYHYWFSGKRILEKPLEAKLNNSKEDLPFMICWANENWTKTWDGEENKVLLNQEYSKTDFENHIVSLIPILKDPRYITKDGKKIIAIYSPQRIQEIDELIRIWKAEASNHDIEIGIVNFISFGGFNNSYNEKFKFSIDFEPHATLSNYKNRKRSRVKSILEKVSHKFGIKLGSNKNEILDFDQFNDFKIKNDQEKISAGVIPCLIPGFDNSPRKKNNFLILKNNSPSKFRNQIKNTFNLLRKEENEQLIFINAWNEWAEGNHLEPCQRWGTKYLEVLKEEIDAFNNNL